MPADLSSILNLEVPVIVRLGEREIAFDDVVSWIPGAIVELQKDVDDQLELLVNNVPIAQGTAVKIGENFGIRISFVGDLQTKIEALGEEDHSDSERDDGEESPMSDDEAAALAEQMLTGRAG